MGEPRDLEDAVRAGLRRSAKHAANAARELISAVGALFDEVVRVKRDAAEHDDDGRAGPSRIEVE
jgi:hypothetical protein